MAEGRENSVRADADAAMRRTTPDQLMQVVYDQLREAARAALADERRGHTLEATALVNEVYLRLADQQRAVWRDERHFYAVAVTMIRRILVDHARGRARAKRGDGWGRLAMRDDLDIGRAAPEGLDLLALDDALERLASLDPRQARVVELRFFGGRTIQETAAIMEVSTTTVEDDWAAARAWLRRALEGAST